MKIFINITVFVLVTIFSAKAQLIPVNLNNWTQEGMLGNGNWIVSGDGTYVDQTINGAPTFFVSPDTLINTTVRGTFSVRTTSDDDFIGFVFGYKRPIGEEDYFNFILLDWKQNSQSLSGGIAQEGFTLSRVEGTVNGNLSGGATPYWSHADTTMEVLASLYDNDKGWADNTEYNFELSYEESRIIISIDSVLIFDVEGEFSAGRFGFYNYSQQNVRYQEFSLNNFPIALNDSVNAVFRTPLDIKVLKNDYDPDGGELSILNFSQPQNGNVILFSDSILTYTPDSSFFGLDSFSYTIKDNFGTSDSARVFVSVDHPPVAVDDSVNTAFGTAVIISVLENDYDPDGVSLEIHQVKQPQNGISELLDGADENRLSYTPDSSFFGLDSFSYTIVDSTGLKDSAMVFISVGHSVIAPVAVDDTVQTDFETPVIISVLDNDFDPDGTSLEIIQLNQPQNGTSALTGNDEVQVEYIPDSTFFGLDSFSYVIADSMGLKDSATVFITVAQPTTLNDFSSLPVVFSLKQNFPNPFNPATTITYQLPKSSNVDLSIYNMAGQKVITLVSEKKPAGSYKVNWDATGFTSGVYLYRLKTDRGFTKTKKLILLK